jgi:FkbM family methyltransferase
LTFLCANGASFSELPDYESLTWGFDESTSIIATPSGLRFHAESIEGLILAETFLFDIHFAGFDLRDKTIIDIGANVGDTALYYAERGATVHAYEPDPDNFTWLKANIDLNRKYSDRIKLFPYAVGKDGDISFSAGLRGASGAFEKRGKSITVRSVSLKSVLPPRDVRTFLLKADCKGAEQEIVLQSELSTCDNIAVEYYPFVGPIRQEINSLTPILNAIQSLGFVNARVFRHNVNNRYPLFQWGMLQAMHKSAMSHV